MTVPDDDRELDVIDIADGAVSISWGDGEGDVLFATD
jgi:hypothetical protein